MVFDNSVLKLDEQAWGALEKIPFLAEKEDIWQCYVHKLRTWEPVGAPNENGEVEVCRPYLLLVISVGSGTFLTSSSISNIFQQTEAPSTKQVLEFLSSVFSGPKVMNSSMEGTTRGPGRPKVIKFCDTTTSELPLPGNVSGESACVYVGESSAALQSVGIEAGYARVPPPLLEQLVRGQIEANFAQKSQLISTLATMPGLRTVEGFTPQFGSSLFKHAEALWTADPWSKMPTDKRRPIKISFILATDENGNAFRMQGYAALLGEGGDGQGLGLYKKPELAWHALQGGDEPEEKSVSAISLMFMSELEMPFQDLDDIERNKWPLPSAAVLPLFFKVDASTEGENAETPDTVTMTRPALLELMWFEMAMQAIVQLVGTGELIGDDMNDLRMAVGPLTVKGTTYGAKGQPETDKDISVECPVHPLMASLFV